ncbi:MAG: preprotein translocase subunit SecY [Candidatus Aenigmarchaeota archaeon]|nr:preprotein translocase subunit SecY [Candidatus Aenigmarchaeota archaeon]
MTLYDAILSKIPAIAEPKGYLNFMSRMKWTGAILLLFLIMGQITLWGVSETSRQQFQTFEMILGSSIGSIVTLGIGPIVTASIILQILSGSKVINFNTSTPEGRARFQGTQKLLAIGFCVFEAIMFIAFGAVKPVSPDTATLAFLVVQLFAGALILLFMDEVVSKWGIGSGISLFIAAGVSKTIFVRAFNPLGGQGSDLSFGLIPQAIQYFTSQATYAAFVNLLPIISTIVVFLLAVYVQSMKVEIPLAFGSIRGFSRRWPLKLLYTSNIPVILIAALLANLQLIGVAMASPAPDGSRCGLLGCFDTNNQAISGVMRYLQAPSDVSVHVFFTTFLLVMLATGIVAYYVKYANIKRLILGSVLTGTALSSLATLYLSGGLPNLDVAAQVVAYFLVITLGSILFSVMWVSTAGMDASSVAKQIESMGMQVPGFRRDPRIIEQVLDRYIPSLAIISGIFIGVLASFADFTGSLGTGTGILLTVTIIYNFYEQISQRYVEDKNPMVRKFFA